MSLKKMARITGNFAPEINEKGSLVTALLWAQLGSNQRPPDYECQMRVASDLHRFVYVYTS